MADLALSGFVSTPEIEGVGDIQLEDPGTYSIVAIDPGGLLWVREEATSPFVHGRSLVRARKDIVLTRLVLRVHGSTHAALHQNVAAILRAFEQTRYLLNLTVGGVTYEWYCQPADYAVVGDGGWDKFGLMSLQQTYAFGIPRDPIPNEGAH